MSIVDERDMGQPSVIAPPRRLRQYKHENG